jgi:NADH dehydrogenase
VEEGSVLTEEVAMILVVGATGQLGSLVVRRLREGGRPVRAMVREPASAEDLAATGAELVPADLRRSETLDAALTGAEAVIATANVVAPTHPGDTSAALDAGYGELVSRARAHGVRRFVLPSIPAGPLDDVVPPVRTKRRLERLLADSGMSYLSIRLPPFTEEWLAMVGSSFTLRGEQRTFFSRPYGFLRGYRRLTGRTVEQFGVMLVPGPPSARHAFISIHDAARLMTAAVDDDALSGCVDIGGPEILSWNDVAALFREVLGRPVRVIGTPAAAFAVLQRLLAPLAPSVSDIMGLERLLGTLETAWDTTDVTDRLGVTGLRTVREVLQDKAALHTVVGSAR